ncbi:C-type lectin domain family 6 member A-like [Sardina pilchardus]|uniref:C-type lectin domain family 6 member A-like n=1 Tax=Sardina pilchardus TaxID=27697 RepID=UPI002E143965
MQQSSGPSHLTRMHQHWTDDQDEEQQTAAGTFSRNHGARSKFKLILPVLILGLLLLTVVITGHVVAQRTGYFKTECQTADVKSNCTGWNEVKEYQAGCQSGKCSDDWEPHGGHCYFFSKKYLNWTQSQEECVHMKSNLTIVNDEEEQKFLMRKIKQKMDHGGDKFWIGLNDRWTEGVWQWVDKSPLNTNQKFWQRNEPDDWKGIDNEYPDGEDCARMGARTFKGKSAAGWVDTACERKFTFICETEACL